MPNHITTFHSPCLFFELPHSLSFFLWRVPADNEFGLHAVAAWCCAEACREKFVEMGQIGETAVISDVENSIISGGESRSGMFKS